MSSRASLILFLILAGGCSATIIPPASPSNPRTIYVADYGRHSSVLLPKPDGKFTEYAWGDWQWFALGDTSPLSGVRALLFSDCSTLGQREVAPQPTDEKMKRTLDADRVLRIECSGDRIEALRDQLNDRFSKHSTTLVHSSYSSLAQVKDDEHYWGLHNCNHVTARWLKQLGCKIEGEPILSHFKVKSHE